MTPARALGQRDALLKFANPWNKGIESFFRYGAPLTVAGGLAGTAAGVIPAINSSNPEGAIGAPIGAATGSFAGYAAGTGAGALALSTIKNPKLRALLQAAAIGTGGATGALLGGAAGGLGGAGLATALAKQGSCVE
jgi:hypothetical protein